MPKMSIIPPVASLKVEKLKTTQATTVLKRDTITFDCPKCDKTYKSRQAMNGHIREKHK